jgi:DNA-binding MarR family transcriptional regulator
MSALTPQILGQAENAHRALFERILDEYGNGYHQWVALSIIARSDGMTHRDALVDRMTAALKIDDAIASRSIDELTAAGLLTAAASDSPGVEFTDEGRERHRRIRAAVEETIARLYAGIPADDLDTAGRVLSEVTERANAELDANAR